jgi:hypothetical protein
MIAKETLRSILEAADPDDCEDIAIRESLCIGLGVALAMYPPVEEHDPTTLATCRSATSGGTSTFHEVARVVRFPGGPDLGGSLGRAARSAGSMSAPRCIAAKCRERACGFEPSALPPESVAPRAMPFAAAPRT